MSQYYDIDDILAEDEVLFVYSLLDGLTSISSEFLIHIFKCTCYCSQIVPAVFQVAANGVGLFDSSDETNKVIYNDETIEGVFKEA